MAGPVLAGKAAVDMAADRLVEPAPPGHWMRSDWAGEPLATAEVLPLRRRIRCRKPRRERWVLHTVDSLLAVPYAYTPFQRRSNFVWSYCTKSFYTMSIEKILILTFDHKKAFRYT